jgi:uncharacterized protein YdeI (YjbR/CyaY-like superfamily)
VPQIDKNTDLITTDDNYQILFQGNEVEVSKNNHKISLYYKRLVGGSIIYEAIEGEKAGLKVNFKKTTAFIIPEEFQYKLDETPILTYFGERSPSDQHCDSTMTVILKLNMAFNIHRLVVAELGR